ncbi:MAG: hypothetical protein OYG31_01185 [Candidatus Kaiserbacteria bacterium]|nr:hypothetical protein [Candidatus Kaiserbacteria bacterium]
MLVRESKKDPLISIMGCEVRAKLVRVFSLNKDTVYIAKDFVKTLRKRDAVIKTVLRNLERDGIVKKKKVPAAERRSKGIRETMGYGYNKRYPHRVFLDTVVEESVPTEQEVLAKKITQVPGVQCVVTTDVYVDRPDTVADIIIASSEDNEDNLKDLIRDAEKIIGRELRCVFLTINELLYRAQTNDRFIRDTLDSSHQVHVDKTGVFVGEGASA